RIDPVEIALPGGVGYTLRAYRPVDLTSAAAGSAPQADADEDAEENVDDYEAAAAAVLRRRRAESPEEEADESLPASDELAEHEETDEVELEADEESDEDELEDEEEEQDEEDEEDEDEEEAEAPEDVPVFLGRRGKVYLFHNAEKLVEFVRSGVEHDMSQLDTWADLVDRITPDDVVAVPDDT